MPLCRECEERTRPAGAEAKADQKKGFPLMTEFPLGARVRVVATSPTSYAGRTGEVVGAARSPAGEVYEYKVKFDGSLYSSVTDLEAVFQPDELEPAPAGPP